MTDLEILNLDATKQALVEGARALGFSELGVASLDVGIPVRYSHQSLEVVDPTDIEGLVTLLDAALDRIAPDLELIRAP